MAKFIQILLNLLNLFAFITLLENSRFFRLFYRRGDGFDFFFRRFNGRSLGISFFKGDSSEGCGLNSSLGGSSIGCGLISSFGGSSAWVLLIEDFDSVIVLPLGSLVLVMLSLTEEVVGIFTNSLPFVQLVKVILNAIDSISSRVFLFIA
jgi:hypothetical protein